MSETTGQRPTDDMVPEGWRELPFKADYLAKFLQQNCTIRISDWQTPQEYLAKQTELQKIISELKGI